MQSFKERVDSFRSSARFYLSNQKAYEAMISDQKAGQNDQQLKILHDDLLYVEDIFNRIHDECGSGARLIIYLLFVENRTQESVARDFNITRRQLQYSLNKWLYTVFGE